MRRIMTIMWREFFESFQRPCFFGEPTSAQDVLDLEQSLSVVLPTELREVFLETNGVAVRPAFFGDIGEEDAVLRVIWTLEELRQQNQELRARDDGSEPAFARLSQFLFFASEPNGDPIGYAVAEGKIVDPQLIVISHEDYEKRHVQCGSLHEYLAILMEASQ